MLPEISFLHPEVFWVLPALVGVWFVWFLIRRRRFVAFSSLSYIQRLRHRPSPLRRMPKFLLALALVLSVIAAMDPVLPFAESRINAEGLDIVLVMDLSSSMAEFVYTERVPTMRLAVTKQALRDFIGRRRDDRIGLVVFSDNAYVISPMTFDYEYLLHYVDEIDDTLLRREGMTAIGEGIFMANVLLAWQSEQKIKNKVIVVFTDGEHNYGRDPIEAVREADATGARTHLIGVDLAQSIKEKPAVQELIGTIKHFGGEYFEANNSRQLAAANAVLARLEKGRLAGTRFERNEPIFTWFAVPALVLVILALGFRAIPYFADLT
jgi:Ca-activated chloride channel family protein